MRQPSPAPFNLTPKPVCWARAQRLGHLVILSVQGALQMQNSAAEGELIPNRRQPATETSVDREVTPSRMQSAELGSSSLSPARDWSWPGLRNVRCDSAKK